MSQAETMAVTIRGISDVGDRYINQDEKGPSFHTNEFMRGYNSGYDDCSGNNSPSRDSPSSGREITPENTAFCHLHPAMMVGCQIGDALSEND